MIVSFKSGLYSSVEGMVPTPVGQTISINGQEFQGYQVSCPLGECGMTYKVLDNMYVTCQTIFSKLKNETFLGSSFRFD